MQRIRVDLPEPDGPQITMRSPLATPRSMSRSTWKSPYHLLSRKMLTMGFSVMVISIAPVCVQPVLDKERITRHAETESEIDYSSESKAREQSGRRRPVGVRERGAQ